MKKIIILQKTSIGCETVSAFIHIALLVSAADSFINSPKLFDAVAKCDVRERERERHG